MARDAESFFRANMTPDQIAQADAIAARLGTQVAFMNDLAVTLRGRGFDPGQADAVFDQLADAVEQTGGRLMISVWVPGVGVVLLDRPSDIFPSA
jgi:hypothetical protein